MSDVLASRIQHASGCLVPGPHVGDVHLLLPVPSAVPSRPYCAALPCSPTWYLVPPQTPCSPGASLPTPGPSVLPASWSPASSPLAPLLARCHAPLVRIKPTPPPAAPRSLGPCPPPQLLCSPLTLLSALTAAHHSPDRPFSSSLVILQVLFPLQESPSTPSQPDHFLFP